VRIGNVFKHLGYGRNDTEADPIPVGAEHVKWFGFDASLRPADSVGRSKVVSPGLIHMVVDK
jgi:hypothetical protein